MLEQQSNPTSKKIFSALAVLFCVLIATTSYSQKTVKYYADMDAALSKSQNVKVPFKYEAYRKRVKDKYDILVGEIRVKYAYKDLDTTGNKFIAGLKNGVPAFVQNHTYEIFTEIEVVKDKSDGIYSNANKAAFHDLQWICTSFQITLGSQKVTSIPVPKTNALHEYREDYRSVTRSIGTFKWSEAFKETEFTLEIKPVITIKFVPSEKRKDRAITYKKGARSLSADGNIKFPMVFFAEKGKGLPPVPVPDTIPVVPPKKKKLIDLKHVGGKTYKSELATIKKKLKGELGVFSIQQDVKDFEGIVASMDDKVAMKKLTSLEDRVGTARMKLSGIEFEIENILKDGNTAAGKDKSIEKKDFKKKISALTLEQESIQLKINDLASNLREIRAKHFAEKMKAYVKALSGKFTGTFQALSNDIIAFEKQFNTLRNEYVAFFDRASVPRSEVENIALESGTLKSSYGRLQKSYDSLVLEIENNENKAYVGWTALPTISDLKDKSKEALDRVEIISGGSANWEFTKANLEAGLSGRIIDDLEFLIPWWVWVVAILLIAGIVFYVRHRKKKNKEASEDAEIEFVSNKSVDDSRQKKRKAAVENVAQVTDDSDEIELNIDIDLNAEENAVRGVISNFGAFSKDQLLHISLEQEWDDSCISEVWMTRSFVNDIYSYSEESLAQKPAPEVGGFILGKYYDKSAGDRKDYEIVAEKFIPAREVDYQDQYEINFGIKAMNELDDALVDNSDMVVLGWFHTHPGHTAFLSNADINIHDGSFREPYQTAIVLDPYTENFDTGIFTRKQNYEMNNKLDSKGYYAWEDFRKKIKDQGNSEIEISKATNSESAGEFYKSKISGSESASLKNVFFSIESIMDVKRMYEAATGENPVGALLFGQTETIEKQSITIENVMDCNGKSSEAIKSMILSETKLEFLGWVSLKQDEFPKPSEADIRSHKSLCTKDNQILLCLSPGTPGINGTINIQEAGALIPKTSLDTYWIELIKWTRIPRYH